MLVRVILHGSLKELYQDVIELHANTAREALEGLKQLDPFNPKKNSKRYNVRVAECPGYTDLHAELETPVLNLHPIEGMSGAFSGGEAGKWQRIGVGILLIALAIFSGGALAGAGLEGAKLVAAELAISAMMTTGLNLIYAGVAGLMTEDDEEEKNRSYTLSYQNTTQSGTPIPIIFGRHRFAGQMLSFNLNPSLSDGVEKYAAGDSIFPDMPTVPEQPGWTTITETDAEA